MRQIHSRYPDITIVYDELIPITVRFFNGDKLLQTVTSYDGVVEYTGETPLKDGETDHSRWSFAGWSPDPSAATGNMDCYAVFVYTGSYARELVQRTIEGAYRNERVTSIGQYAFTNCNKLTSVDFPNVTTVGAYAFQACNKIVSVNIPMLNKIEKYTFNGCSALTAVNFPVVASIGQRGFSGCSAMTIADFAVVERIDADAFLNCKAIVALIVRSETVCSLSGVLTGTPIASGTGYIYVPRVLVDSYKAATNWSTYAAQIRAIEDYPEICGGDE
jgi:hypothetical protein